MKLLTALITLLTAVVLVPTAVSRPLLTDPTTGPGSLGKPRSIGQASHFSPKPVQLDTNAKRFARGLPPLAPSKSRRYEASPVRRTGASPLPPVTCTSCSGVIQVYNRDTGNSIGYISSIGNGNPGSMTYQVQAARNSDTLRVHFTVPAGTTGTVTNLNIVPDNSKLPNANVANYLGLVTWGDNTVNDGAGSPGFAFMAATILTPAGSTPVSGTNSWVPASISKVESAVWTVDVSTWSLTLKWVNPDGSLSGGHPFTEDAQILFGYPEYKASGNPSYKPERLNLSFKFVPDVTLPPL